MIPKAVPVSHRPPLVGKVSVVCPWICFIGSNTLRRMAHCFPLFARSRGAALAGLGTPIITEAFPPAELGFALGINSIAWVLGSLIGPVPGGISVSVWGWRSIFYVTIPFSLAAAAIGWRVLPHSPRKSSRMLSIRPD